MNEQPRSAVTDAAAWYAWFKGTGGPYLRRLVTEEWDPIGVSGHPEASDEYDSYVPLLADRLRHGDTAPELASLLSVFRIERMGLSEDAVADRRAADAMVSWYAESNAPR